MFLFVLTLQSFISARWFLILSLPVHIQFSLEKEKLSLASGRDESNPLLLHPLVCTAALALLKILWSKFETCSLERVCVLFSIGGLYFVALYI